MAQSRLHSDKLVDEMLTHLHVDFADHEPNSEVATFYSGRSVFITGATGFIGKSLVEKLVRSCSGIKRIYLLIREKGGEDIKQRMAALIGSRIFGRLRSIPGGVRRLEQLLVPVKGDITMAGLGISESDMAMLSEEISIVFNSAATIRFSEPLDVAVRNNIISVQQLVAFCDRLRKLNAIVHLSTAYSNCHKRDTIFEVFYEPPMSGDQIIDAVQALRQIQSQIGHTKQEAHALQSFHGTKESSQPDQQLLAEFTQIALQQSHRPNTYTFTKAISENYLADLVRRRADRYLSDQGIPVCIVRPSIVGGTWREPEVGFVDNYNGPTGAMLSLYTGALQAMPGTGDRVADIVPIDMVSNMVLCAAWYLVDKRAQVDEAAAAAPIEPDQGVYIFNFVSGFRNPLRWHQVTDLIADLSYKYPSKYLVRLPGSYFIKAGDFYDFYDTINHKLPAKVHDWFRRKVLREKLDKRSSWLAGASRIRQMTDALTPFTSNQWLLCDANVCALNQRLSAPDRRLFPFDVSKIDWLDYIRNYMIGARIYALGDDARNVPKALSKLKRRLLLTRLSLSGLVLLFVAYLLWLLSAGQQEA